MTAAQIVEHYGGKLGKCRCPAHDDKDPSLGVVERDGRVLVKCYSGCAQSDVIDALRRDGVWPEASDDAPRERSWKVRRPDGKHVEHMRVDKADGKRIWWKPALRPLKVCDLSLYAVDQVPRESHLVVITEGEPACDALLADGVPAVGTVTGASGCPGDLAMRELVATSPRRIICWPDADDVGRRHMMRVQSALTRIAPNLRVDVLDPSALGLVSKGDDAADWVPGEGTDPGTAILQSAVPPSGTGREQVGNCSGNSSGNSSGGVPEVLPEGEREQDPPRIWQSWAEVEDVPLVPDPLIPALAWEAKVTFWFSDSKLGKSTLLAQGLAAARNGDEFLDGVAKKLTRIAVMEEMGAAVLKRWIVDQGVDGDWPEIDFVRPCKFSELLDYHRERQPQLMIIDTVAAFTSSSRMDENAAGDMRLLRNVAAAHGGAVVLYHHENKDGDFRGSTDLKASADMVVHMRPAKDHKRVLHFRGRWPIVDKMVLAFDKTHRKYTVSSSDGDDRGVDLLNEIAGAGQSGITKNQLVKRLGWRRATVYQLVNDATADGCVVARNGHLYTSDNEPEDDE